MSFASIDKPSKYFNTNIWTGNGTSQNITGLNFQPDFVWIKERTSTSSHAITDAVRGNTKYLMSNDAGAEETLTDRVTSFNSDGYSLGSSGGVNQSGQDNVGWSWKANGAGVSNTSGTISSTVSANTTSGFSVVTYTGNGTSGATFGHGLGVAPAFTIVKNRSTGGRNWQGFHKSLGNTKSHLLNSTEVPRTNSVFWNNTSPTSTLITLGNDADVNESGQTFIAYCFAEIKGFSKAFSYTGNGSSDGNFVYCGFRPAYVLIKNTSIAQDWFINDNKRLGYNGGNYVLYPDLSSAEASSPQVDILSNGFKTRTVDAMINNSGYNYVGFAFAEQPFVSSKGIVANAR